MLLFGIITLSMFLFIRPIKGNIQTIYTHIVDQDTYIEEYYDRSLPTSNRLQVGCHYISFPEPQWESYFFFNFTDKPENITKTEIRISLVRPNVHNPYNFSIDVYLIEEQWNQIDIKWSNKPNKSDFIKRFDNEYITDGSHDYLQFNISKYSNRDNISIVLTPSLDRIDAQNHVYLHSREAGGNKPKIIWTCLEYDDMPPSISINEPNENQVFYNTPPSFNVYIVERLATGITSQWYTLDNGISNYIFSLTNNKTGMDSYGEYISAEGIGVINQTVWNRLENGNVIIRFYAEDGNGNVGYGVIVVMKNTTEPIVINNDIIILIGVSVLAVVGVIYRIKVKKKI